MTLDEYPLLGLWSPGPKMHHLRVEWREIGGPQVVPSERKGFGTRMLERIFDPWLRRDCRRCRFASEAWFA